MEQGQEVQAGEAEGVVDNLSNSQKCPEDRAGHRAVQGILIHRNI